MSQKTLPFHNLLLHLWHKGSLLPELVLPQIWLPEAADQWFQYKTEIPVPIWHIVQTSFPLTSFPRIESAASSLPLLFSMLEYRRSRPRSESILLPSQCIPAFSEAHRLSKMCGDSYRQAVLQGRKTPHVLLPCAMDPSSASPQAGTSPVPVLPGSYIAGRSLPSSSWSAPAPALLCG